MRCLPIYAYSILDTFAKIVFPRSENKNDNGSIVTEDKISPSNHVDKPQTSISQEENLSSILKKSDKQEKKAVHFPENIVSVKFYNISDDEDSDNDTLILSDPEEDDYCDQEVPINTYDEYNINCYYPSSTNMDFIPQLMFPPVLKINNSQLYDGVDDDHEEILAIMADDDKHEESRASDLKTNELRTAQDSFKKDANLPEGLDFGRSLNDRQNGQVKSVEGEKLCERSEASFELDEVLPPFSKSAVQRREADLYGMSVFKNNNQTFEVKNLEVNQETLPKVEARFDNLKNEICTTVTKDGTEKKSENDCQNDQLISTEGKVDHENPEMIGMKKTTVIKGDCSENQEETLYKNEMGTTEVKEVEEPTKEIEIEAVEGNVEIKLQQDVENTFVTEPESSLVNKNSSAKVNSNQSVQGPAVTLKSLICAKHGEDMKVCEGTEDSTLTSRAIHGNCARHFLWHGPSSINRMILDEVEREPVTKYFVVLMYTVLLSFLAKEFFKTVT